MINHNEIALEKHRTREYHRASIHRANLASRRSGVIQALVPALNFSVDYAFCAKQVGNWSGHRRHKRSRPKPSLADSRKGFFFHAFVYGDRGQLRFAWLGELPGHP